MRRQIEETKKQTMRVEKSSSISIHEEDGESSSYSLSSLREKGYHKKNPMRKWRPTSNSNDFRVQIPEFEGKLDPDEFLEWLHIVERIFEYKEVPEDKKVKLVALRLRSMPLYDGLTFVQKGLEIEKKRFDCGRR